MQTAAAAAVTCPGRRHAAAAQTSGPVVAPARGQRKPKRTPESGAMRRKGTEGKAGGRGEKGGREGALLVVCTWVGWCLYLWIWDGRDEQCVYVCVYVCVCVRKG